MPSEDFKPGEFPELSWESDNAAKSLQSLYEYVTSQAKASREWYLRKRSKKREAGYILRLGAVLAAALAGIIPILSGIFETGGIPRLSPVWSSVAIAVAALFVAIDRLGDMTSGWVRYMLTSQEIAKLEESFRFDWETEKLRWATPVPTQEELSAGLSLCGVFLQNVNKAVREETRMWADEFLTTLRQIEKAAEIVAERKELGGINITVKNGDRSKDGWTLRVGDGPERKCIGKSATAGNLLPGIHKIMVKGEVSGKSVATETSVLVTGGKVSNLELAL